MADRTKASFNSVSYPGDPHIDSGWGAGLNSEAIQCNENQYAGPGAKFMQQPQMGTLPKPNALPRSGKYQ